MNSKLQLDVVTTVHGAAISWTGTKAKRYGVELYRLNCVIHVWAPWGRDACHLRCYINPRTFTFTFTFTGYTPAKFHICIFNGCNAIVLTTFSWLSGTNKQTNIITPAKILASRNHLNGGPHYNKCFLSHFLVCRHTHTHTHTHTQTDRQTDRQKNTMKTLPVVAIVAGTNCQATKKNPSIMTGCI